MTAPLERVLSGQSELSIRGDYRAVRDILQRQPDGTWKAKEPIEHVDESTADMIRNHPCVVLRHDGCLKHYGIRKYKK
jgi:hypothetical protein